MAGLDSSDQVNGIGSGTAGQEGGIGYSAAGLRYTRYSRSEIKHSSSLPESNMFPEFAILGILLGLVDHGLADVQTLGMLKVWSKQECGLAAAATDIHVTST